MPSRPARITDLSHPDAVKVLNDLLNQLSDRIDDVAKKAASQRISASPTISWTTILTQSFVDRAIHVPGARIGMVAHANPTLPLTSGATPSLVWSAWVSASDTVTIRLANVSTTSKNATTQRWSILVS